MTYDSINNSHYTPHGIFKQQPIDIMRMTMTPDAYKGYLIGNVIKYVMRYDAKNGREDLEKAKSYIDYLIEEIED